MKLHHVGIIVKDIKRSVAWYTTQFNVKTEYMDDSWVWSHFQMVVVCHSYSRNNTQHIFV